MNIGSYYTTTRFPALQVFPGRFMRVIFSAFGLVMLDLLPDQIDACRRP